MEVEQRKGEGREWEGKGGRGVESTKIKGRNNFYGEKEGRKE